MFPRRSGWRSRLKNASCLGCKSPSRFQRELDSRSRQTSLMSRPFGRGIRPSSIFGGLYELTQRSSESPALCGLQVRRSTLLKARGDTRSDDSLTALGTLSTLSRQTWPELRAFSFRGRTVLDYRCMPHTKVRRVPEEWRILRRPRWIKIERNFLSTRFVYAQLLEFYAPFCAQVGRLIFLLCLQSNNIL